jgi:hypothetical protein
VPQATKKTRHVRFFFVHRAPEFKPSPVPRTSRAPRLPMKPLYFLS